MTLLAIAAVSAALHQAPHFVGHCSVYEQSIAIVWNAYELAPKIDRPRGKKRDQDFSHKDPLASSRLKMTLRQYVIGGMNKDFVIRLANLILAAREAGFEVGITSGYRDSYRQSLITAGTRSATGASYHGSRPELGHGKGMAADIVALAQTREEQRRLNPRLWKWVEENGKSFGLGIPYGTHDGGHVAPVVGEEYVEKYRPARSWVMYFARLKAGLKTLFTKKKSGKKVAKKHRRKQVASR